MTDTGPALKVLATGPVRIPPSAAIAAHLDRTDDHRGVCRKRRRRLLSGAVAKVASVGKVAMYRPACFLLRCSKHFVSRKLGRGSDPTEGRKHVHVERARQEGQGVNAGLHKGTEGVEAQALFGEHVSPSVPFPILSSEPLGNR